MKTPFFNSSALRLRKELRVILLKLLELDAQIFPVRAQSKDNIVADVLSRRFEPGGSPFPQWLSMVVDLGEECPTQ